MPKSVLIAPVGWYEERLWKSLLKSGADKIYLIRDEKKGIISEITKAIASSLKKRLSAYGKAIPEIDDEVQINFQDLWDVYATFIKIIERERYKEPKATITIDVTSTTKEGALAASLVGRLYDVRISHVPSKEKFSEITSLEGKDLDMAVKKTLENVKQERYDPGNEYLQFNFPPTPLHEDWIKAMVKVSEFSNSPKSLIIKRLMEEEEKRKTKGAAYRYWVRVFDKLESEGLIEYTTHEKSPSVTLRGLAKPLIAGLIEARKLE